MDVKFTLHGNYEAMGSIVSKCSCANGFDDRQLDLTDSDESLPPISSLYVPFQDRHRFIYDERYLLNLDDKYLPSKSYSMETYSPVHSTTSSTFADDSKPSDVADSDQESVMTFVSPSKDRSFYGEAR